eukprot:gnl/Dysnectes_brevis/703_a775_4852.p1 GENE.gnl/Dysnectes_brevis/703_a775_4852~~gnl/Dysnectes_brevis/703_a775_4852.p1  ORF type:complete len:365 (+),score=141.18 gnl/Dysnectes_brevis/703_a775_4852:41-1135(+)
MSFSITDLKITRNPSPPAMPPKEELKFGHNFSAHMAVVDYTDAEGWSAPEIIPFQNLSLHPSVTSLHYGLEVFEGMKAYLGEDGQIRLFRPIENTKRLKRSCTRLAMACPEPEDTLELIKRLVLIDKEYIPKAAGFSMYIRPFIFSTHDMLGVTRPTKLKLVVIMSPSGPYFSGAPMLWATTKFARAARGGTGDCKCGGNYAGSIYPQAVASEKGCQQVLWLSPEDYVSEVGAANFLVAFKHESGKYELVTAPLDGMILPGITRNSILALARSDTERFIVTERNLPIAELIERTEKGDVVEAFGCGTAAVVTHIKGVLYENEVEEKRVLFPESEEVSQIFYNHMTGIQWGKIEHEWAMIVGSIE